MKKLLRIYRLCAYDMATSIAVCSVLKMNQCNRVGIKHVVVIKNVAITPVNTDT
mgnify:CR=1 FL=1